MAGHQHWVVTTWHRCVSKLPGTQPLDLMSSHVISCHVISCHVMSCHVMSCIARASKICCKHGCTTAVPPDHCSGCVPGHLIPVQPTDRNGRAHTQQVRHRAAEFRIDPGRVGVLGVSAGGHLPAPGQSSATPLTSPLYLIGVSIGMERGCQQNGASPWRELCHSADALSLRPY